MKTTRSLKFATIALVALGLSACGGGGGSDTVKNNSNPPAGGNGGTTTPTAMTGSIDQTSASIGENGSADFVITTKDKDQALNVEITASTTGSVDYTVNGDVVSVSYSVGDIQSETTASFSVAVKDKDDTLEYTITVDVANTSAEAVIASAQAVVSSIEAQSFGSDLELVGDSYIALQFIGGDINGATKASHKAQLSNAISTMQTSLYSGEQSLASLKLGDDIAAYQNGSIDEGTLANNTQFALSKVNASAEALLSVLNDIADASANTPALPSYTVTATSESVSGLIGNDDYGQWDDETWVFADKYSILEDAASTPCFQ